MSSLNNIVNSLFSMSVAFIAFMVPVSQGIIVKLKEKYSDDAIIEIYLKKSKYLLFNVLLSINLILSFVYWMVEPIECKGLRCFIYGIFIILTIVTFIFLYVYLLSIYRFSRGGVALANELYRDLKTCIDKSRRDKIKNEK